MLSSALFAEDPYEVDWTIDVDTSQGDLVTGVDVDKDGNVYMIGMSRGDAFRTNRGVGDRFNNEPFLVKYNASGDELWAVQRDENDRGNTSQRYRYLKVDALQNVFVYCAMGLYCCDRILKFSKDGQLVWTRSVPSGRSYLSVDDEGGVYLTARYDAVLHGIKVMKFSSNGSLTLDLPLYGLPFPSHYSTTLVVSGPDGGLYVAGNDEGTPYFARYDESGSQEWLNPFGEQSYTSPERIEFDREGSAYLLHRVSTESGKKYQLSKVDSGGQWKWTTDLLFGDGIDLAIGNSGDVYVFGYEKVTSDIEDERVSAILLKYDTEGELLWEWGLPNNLNSSRSSTTRERLSASVSVGVIEGTVSGDAVYVGGQDDRSLVESEGRVGFLSRYVSGDTDGDGLLDEWETDGIPYVDSMGRDQRFLLPDADPFHKDLYVEVDSMQGLALSEGALLELEFAFYLAPYTNPDGDTGATLHLLIDETDLPFEEVWQTDGCWPLDFDEWRLFNYGTTGEQSNAELLEAKALAYRYCIVANASGPKRIGGCGLTPGDDFVIFIGSGYSDIDQAAVFMHELGHNLGLKHGGADDINGKVNYPSVMNYAYSYRQSWNEAFWTLDFTRTPAGEFDVLYESALDETVGVGEDGGFYEFVFLPFGVSVQGSEARGFDYLQLDGGEVDFGDLTNTNLQDGSFDSSVSQDLNYIDTNLGVTLPKTASAGEEFYPHDDWKNTTLKLAAAMGDDALPGTFPQDELTIEAKDWMEANFPVPAGANWAPELDVPANVSVSAHESTPELTVAVSDEEDAGEDLVLTATSDSPHLIAASGISLGGFGESRTIQLTPLDETVRGVAKIMLTVTDTDGRSTHSSFELEILAFANALPELSVPPHQIVAFKNHSSDVYPFSVTDMDETASGISVSASSSNQFLISDENIKLEGEGSERSFSFTTNDAFGDFVNITLTATDSFGGSSEFRLRVFVRDNAPPAVYVPTTQIFVENALEAQIGITVYDGEEGGAPLEVTVRSDSQELIPDSGLSVHGNDESRYIIVAPEPDVTGGPVSLTIRATDSAGLSSEEVVMVIVDSAESNPWLEEQTRAPLPTPRHSLSSVSFGGNIYTIGGANGYPIVPVVEVYDPTTDLWESRAEMPTARQDTAVAVVDGKIFVIGGQIQEIEDNISGVNEVYDPVSDAWSVRASLPQARTGASAIAFENRIYVFGGRNFSVGNLDTVDIYEPDSDTWSSGGVMPFADNYFRLSLIGEKLFLVGGRQDADSVWQYDFGADSWERKADIPTPRQNLATVVLDGKIYATGGAPDASSVVEVYDPEADAWASAPQMPTARGFHSAVSVGNSIYVIGGRSNYENFEATPSSRIVERFTLASGEVDAEVFGFKIRKVFPFGDADYVTLSWPATSAEYVLETSSTLGDEWSVVSQFEAETNAGEIRLNVPKENDPQFYRLRLVE
ncbi:kelch repeat protein [Verrucomicrobiia bacterium DG1235]|nr:kelch repeat protein [Verrucomicrobiae bacterium DG1235]